MKNYLKIYILLICIVMCASCGKNESRKIDLVDDTQNSKLNKPISLNRKLYDENFIATKLIKGLSKNEVEKIIGQAFKYSKFMDTVRAEYRLTEPEEKGLHMIGFTVVYKNDFLYSVDEDWLGIP